MLEKYDEKCVTIHTRDNEAFEGRALYLSREFCEAEYDRDEAALEIDDWLFFEDEIAGIELSGNAIGKVWCGKPQHAMHLLPEPYAKIGSGAKVYELRLCDAKRRLIKEGDVIRFALEDPAAAGGSGEADDFEEVMRVKVTSITLADSFVELFNRVPIAECGFGPDVSAEEAAAAMGKYYSPETQSLFKAMAIGVEVI
ncbi:MAG: hypothetical protein ILO53_04505 [Clostridia bacterium]|nr:hypothetical protein [Clostridia bacterium]